MPAYKVVTLMLENRELLNILGEGAKIHLQKERSGYHVWDVSEVIVHGMKRTLGRPC